MLEFSVAEQKEFHLNVPQNRFPSATCLFALSSIT